MNGTTGQTWLKEKSRIADETSGASGIEKDLERRKLSLIEKYCNPDSQLSMRSNKTQQYFFEKNKASMGRLHRPSQNLIQHS